VESYWTTWDLASRNSLRRKDITDEPAFMAWLAARYVPLKRIGA
jgi:hypothetical protein